MKWCNYIIISNFFKRMKKNLCIHKQLSISRMLQKTLVGYLTNLDSRSLLCFVLFFQSLQIDSPCFAFVSSSVKGISNSMWEREAKIFGTKSSGKYSAINISVHSHTIL